MTAASSIRHQVCRHDLVFDFFPESYFEGLLLGNGDLGGMLWFEGDDLVLSLDKTDVWEHRADQNLEPGMDFRTAVRQAREGSFDPHSRLFDPRRPPDRIWGNKLPIGRVVWPLPARPLAFRAELCIYDATFVATVEFESGELQLGGFIHATEPQIRLEITASGDLEMPAAEPRSQCLDEASKKTYRDAWKYPEPEYGSKHGDLFVSQEYGRQEKFAVVVRPRAKNLRQCQLDVTVVRGAATDDLQALAAEQFDRMAQRGDISLLEEHRRWWQGFWSRSQLSVPDGALERLWYMELYKLGCNARPDKEVVSIMGVWNPDWRIPPCYGDLHHNLETEMNYWPIFAANHLELAQPLYDLLLRGLPRFERNTETFFGWEGAYLPANMDNHGQGVGFMWYPWNLQVGVGAWLAQHFWWHYLYSGDLEFLRNQAWPYMESVGRFWLGFLEEEEDGRLHVPWSYSPEYDDIVRKGKDSAFDLSLVRFLFTTIVEVTERLDMDAAVSAPYRHSLDRLEQLPVGDTGIQVYADKPLEVSHRHFSHLMAIYPLGFLNNEGGTADRELIDRSLKHLRTIGTGNWSGWSWAWIALIAARTGRTNMAHNMLRFYTDNVMLHNTQQVSVDWKQTGVYTAEHGLINTLEAGTGAAAAIMELLLQSWGEKIRVFPCLPEAWSQASFTTLRAEGAFLVSAEYREGAVRWIRINSEAGNRCRLANPWEGGAVLHQAHDGASAELRGAELSFATEIGGQYELCPAVPPKSSPPHGVGGQKRFGRLPRWD